MAGKKGSTISVEKIALYDKLIASIPGVERKGDTNPYTSLNGHMFSHLTPEGIFSLRLPEKEIGPFLKKYKTKLMEAYGIIRKEYVVVPDSLLAKTAELTVYFNISYTHIKILKPKPTTKTKK